MSTITFISTIHKESGMANPEELYNIINKINPDVVFLEALPETYSDYDKLLFESFDVKHEKLELSALQHFAYDKSFEYVPVVVSPLSEDFQKKNEIICQYSEIKRIIDKLEYLTNFYGFDFLNSSEGMLIHEEIIHFGSSLLKDDQHERRVKEDIDRYENEMLQNIYAYAQQNEFEIAIFMCGSAHRKSIIEKINMPKEKEGVNLIWKVFGESNDNE